MASSLPPTLDFAKTEEEICAKWAAEQTFKNQDALSLDRGDKVSSGKWRAQRTVAVFKFDGGIIIICATKARMLCAMAMIEMMILAINSICIRQGIL